MTKKESNVLKGIAIMLMLWHHLFMYADTPGFPPLAYGPLLDSQRLAALGQLSKLCVAIFVFVTAYGTAMSYRSDSMRDERALMAKSLGRYIRLMISFQLVYIIAFLLCPLGGKSWLTLYSPSRLENLAFAFFDFMGLSYILPSPSYNSAWWYMSLAVTLVLLLPWVIKLCRRFGWYLLLPALLVVRWAQAEFVICRYLLLIVLGIVMADSGLWESLEARLKGRRLKKVLISLAGLLVLGLCAVLWLRADDKLYDVYESAMVLALLPFALWGLGRVPLLGSALAFLGRHSMNIFFFHAFIYQNWFGDFTYSLRYPLLIWGFLLLSSLAFSVLLEALKKPLHVPQLIDWLSGRANALLLPRERA